MRNGLVAIFAAVSLSLAWPAGAAKPEPSKANSEKMVMLGSEKEIRENFSYFPGPLYPYGATAIDTTGIYRVHLNAEGRVTEINVLRSMGPVINDCVIKALTKWRAKPNAPRVVGVGFFYFNLNRFMNTR